MYVSSFSYAEKPSYVYRFRKTIEYLSYFNSRENVCKNCLKTHAIFYECRTQPQTQTHKKRNYTESFGERDYELERYGQEINATFFENNIGHGVN